MSSACAKIILLGEHAVVYGEPAIAVPVSSLRAYATIDARDTDFQIVACDLNDKVITFDDVDTDPLAKVVQQTLIALKEFTPSIQIGISSKIPIASGLGSGAAISTAIVRLLAEHFNRQLSQETINSIVYEVEKIHHGTPSGIDNTVIVYEQPIYYVRNQPIELVEIKSPLRIVVGDTGKEGLTKESVGDVRKLYNNQPEHIKPILAEIGQIVVDARQAMRDGDLQVLGHLMNDNHTALQQLTVSSSELDILVQSARDAGALGAKLSGGGRGGNMIALVTEDTVQPVMEGLRQAGATRVFETIVDTN